MLGLRGGAVSGPRAACDGEQGRVLLFSPPSPTPLQLAHAPHPAHPQALPGGVRPVGVAVPAPRFPGGLCAVLWRTWPACSRHGQSKTAGPDQRPWPAKSSLSRALDAGQRVVRPAAGCSDGATAPADAQTTSRKRLGPAVGTGSPALLSTTPSGVCY